MTEIDGGPAFPIPYASDMDGYVYAPHASGMSLRDYFAAAALEFLADWEGDDSALEAAHRAYAYADAMLKVRKP